MTLQIYRILPLDEYTHLTKHVSSSNQPSPHPHNSPGRTEPPEMTDSPKPSSATKGSKPGPSPSLSFVVNSVPVEIQRKVSKTLSALLTDHSFSYNSDGEVIY